MENNRRSFIKKTVLSSGAIMLGTTAKSYSRILGSNDRVRVGIIGFSNRCRGSLVPAFVKHQEAMNFEFVAVSDLWNRRREEAIAHVKEKAGSTITAYR